MATGTAVARYHGTLTAATVDTITMTGPSSQVSVINRGTTDLFFTVDGSTPTVGGAETYAAAAGKERILPNPQGNWSPAAGGSQGSLVVKLISSSTPAYTVSLL